MFIAYAMLFLISIPTLAGAMTGYTPIIDPFIRRNDSSLIPFRELPATSYIIQDGSRVNLTDNYFIGSQRLQHLSGSQSYMPVSYRDGSHWLSNYGYDISDCGYRYFSGTEPEMEHVYLLANVSSYVSQYGFYGLTKAETTWMNETLESPALNITASFLPGREQYDNESDIPYGHDWTDPRTDEKPFSNPQKRTYYDSQGNVYSLDYVISSGSCQPSVEGCDATFTKSNSDAYSTQIYNWGFSLVQATITAALAMIWTIGLYIMYLAAHLQLPLMDTPEIPRGWRAVVRLGETIRRELDSHGIDPESLIDKQPKRLVLPMTLTVARS
ncbi:hypothetical protein B0H67DRAFT_667261 [Lasiosphaeris hirsuta]|uniref:Uncharacterized protein n=1 Tax=Lasiosphaeris hirsuta TaxID=260670 RepID=A0AA40AIE3_9PEZI|nr:hypothetical protein B0H67DRAFT_667261 [Lasiosphaeris hirsuta]